MASSSERHIPAVVDEAAVGGWSESTSPHVLSGADVAQEIHAIWADVLGLGDFGMDDDFFELGGHSLLAPKVVSRIRRTLGAQVAVMDFFESPTVSGLASVVVTRLAGGSSTLRRRPPDAEPVLSFDQQRLWLENQLLPGSAYNVHGRRRLVGELDVVALEASVRTILVRHEALRTRFPLVNGVPVQVVDPLDGSGLQVVDLSGSGVDQLASAVRLVDEQASRPFDLASGPLVRCVLVRLSDTDHVLAVTMHHIVSDAWSIEVFIRELSALYQAGGDPKLAELPPLTIQYRDYAFWQRARLTGETLDREVAYWREHLAGAPAALALPTAHRRVIARRSGQRLRAELADDLTASLRERCREHGVSPFMMLLSVLAAVLSRWSGQRDMVIGVPTAGRGEAGTDALIGFFVNTLPIRVDLSGNPTFAELFGRVREVCLAGYAHAQAPVDVLVEKLPIVRDPRRTPLFEVILNVIGDREVEQVSGLVIEEMDSPPLPSKFDLALNAQDVGGRLQIHLDYNADRFTDAMMRVLLGQIEIMVGIAVRAAQTRPLDCDLSTPAPAASQETGPATGRPVASPDQIAVVDAAGRWSFGWLTRAAAQISQAITSTGHIGLVRRDSAAFVAAVLACAAAGVEYTVIEADSPIPSRFLGISTVVDIADGSIELSDLASPGGAGVLIHGWAIDRFDLSSAERVTVLSHDPALLVAAVTTALAAGATFYLPPVWSSDVDDWLRDHAISALFVDPPQLRALSGSLPQLRYVFVTNAHDLICHDVEAVRKLAPTCHIVGVYQVGRDGCPAASYEIPDGWLLATAPLRVPLGQELAGSGLELRHPAGQAAAIGEVTEVYVGSRATGDLARRWPDGTLEFVAKVGTDPLMDVAETAAALRDLPDVVDAVVVESLDESGHLMLVGYLAGPDSGLGSTAVRQSLLVRLPETLIPRQVFVLAELPRTRYGDYDLGALPEPDLDTIVNRRYVAPRTPIERDLTAIFEELLDLPQVGVHDTFFDLSGFSLLATRLAARIQDTFGVELSLRDVFGSPTVEGLAQLILHTQSELSGLPDIGGLLDRIESAGGPAATGGPGG